MHSQETAARKMRRAEPDTSWLIGHDPDSMILKLRPLPVVPADSGLGGDSVGSSTVKVKFPAGFWLPCVLSEPEIRSDQLQLARSNGG